MTTLNEIIMETDNDIIRLYQGREISRSRSKTDIKSEEHRIILEQKLSDGDFTSWELLKSMSCAVGNINTQNIDLPSDSELSEDDGDQNITEQICLVCLSQRTNTWVIMP